MEIVNPCSKYSPNAWVAWENISEDFKPVMEQMLLTLLSRVPKYGLSYRTNNDISYYLSRLKKEIKEFEKTPSIFEGADIANFAMMIIYHMMKQRELERQEELERQGANWRRLFDLEGSKE